MWTWARFVWWLRSKREDFVMTLVWWMPPSFIYWAGMRLFSNATTGCFGARSPGEMKMFDVLEDWRQKRGGDRAFRREDL